MALHFLETENVYLSRVFSIQSVFFILLRFKGVTLQTLDGLYLEEFILAP